MYIDNYYQNFINQSIQRMSSGLRINSAKDDPANLFISKGIQVEISGLNMATQNAKDGRNYLQTIEGSLDSIQNNLHRMNELSIQSANGTLSDGTREGLQKEVEQLNLENNRILDNTDYENIDIHIGTKSDSNITTDLPENINLENIDISTVENSQDSITKISDSIDYISELRTEVGSNINRYDSIVEFNQTSSINYSDYNSRIEDADYAKQMSEYLKTLMLQNVSIALQSYDNIEKLSVMNLLRNI